MYGLLITARMNERLHNAVHRCRWRLDPLCVLLQTIRQPRCMGCFYLRPVIDVLNCPLWLVRLARTGWFHVTRGRGSRWQKDPSVNPSFLSFPSPKLHPPISAGDRRDRLSYREKMKTFRFRERDFQNLEIAFLFFLFAGEKGGRKEKLAFREITGNKSFATFIRVPVALYNASTTFPFFPIIKINLNRITKKTRWAKENTH